MSHVHRRIKKGRVLAAIGAAALLITGPSTGKKIYEKYKENQKLKVYSTDLKPDINNRPINIVTENSDSVIKVDNKDINNYDVILLDTFEENRQVYVALVDLEGNIVSGYIESRYVDLENMTEIKEFTTADEFNDLAVVSKKDVWATPEKKEYRYNGDNVFLEMGTYVVAALPETSTDNKDVWKKVIYSSKGLNSQSNTYQVGYVKEDCLVYADFEKYTTQEMEVVADVLRLREEPTTDSTIVDRMIRGQKVIRILSEPGLEDGEYRWLYVAYKDELGTIKFGWSAEAELDERGQEIRYLQSNNYKDIQIETEKNEDFNQEIINSNQNKEYVTKMVNTVENNNANLNLRDNPGLQSNVIGKIENGTVLYISNVKYNNLKEIDNKQWVQVTLDDGTEGWVSVEYLEDYSEEVISTKFDYKSYGEGVVNGYVGIDVATNSITSQKLEQILKTQSVSNYQQPYTGNVEQLKETQNINFVYLRLDATTYGKFGFANNTKENREEVKKMADLCEKYKIPFGFYYYSQSLTDDKNTYAIDKGITNVNEVKAEEDYIYDRLSQMNYEDYKYCVLPFAYDVEWNVDKENPENSSVFYKTWKKYKQDNPFAKEDFTYMKVNAMKGLKERLGMDVILYTNNEMLSTVFDSTITDEFPVWVVDPNKTHSDALLNIPGLDMQNDVKCRQVGLGSKISLANSQIYNGEVDFNVMNSDFFEKCVRQTDYLDRMEKTNQKANDIQSNKNFTPNYDLDR